MAASRFTSMSNRVLTRSLSTRLQGTVDRIRDLPARFGQRPYRVQIVRTRWSGGQRGAGVEEAVWAEEILPTPRLSDPQSLSEVVSYAGLEELGSLRVDRVSGRYGEDFLRGIDETGVPTSPDTSLYYEITFVGRPAAERRRYSLAHAPGFDAAGFQWILLLERTPSTQAPRDRSDMIGVVR